MRKSIGRAVHNDLLTAAPELALVGMLILFLDLTTFQMSVIAFVYCPLAWLRFALRLRLGRFDDS